MSAPLSSDRDEAALAHALGAGTQAERLAAVEAIRTDPEFAGRVAAWNERLARLAAAVPPVEPTPATLRDLRLRLDQETASAAAPRANVVAFPERDQLTHVRRSRAFWRGGAIAASGLAAVLALALGLDIAGKPPGRTYVAAVNRTGELPALIVRVDGANGVVQVRTVAAELPADRSLELWSVTGQAPPRSLGLVSAAPATKLRLEGEAARIRDGVTVAVSIEPKGGSPTGAPTGPVVYSGKLVAESP